jgi:F-type H+-transporting ATPase subunit b
VRWTAEAQAASPPPDEFGDPVNDPGDRLQRLLPGLLLPLFAAAPAQASEGGLTITPDGPLLLLLIVAFALLIFPVNALIFRPIFRVLDAREQRITGTRRRADQVAQEAEAVTHRYEEALQRAREENALERGRRVEVARSEGARGMAEARGIADREIEAARSQLAAILDEARQTLRTQAEQLARDAAARLLGRAL